MQGTETTLIDFTGPLPPNNSMMMAASGGVVPRQRRFVNGNQKSRHQKTGDFHDDEDADDDETDTCQRVLGAEAAVASANYYEDLNFTLEDDGDFLGDESEFSPPPSYAEVIEGTSDLHPSRSPSSTTAAASGVFLSPTDLKVLASIQDSDQTLSGTL